MANPIENWLYKGATQPRSHYANMPLWKAMPAEIPFSKSYEGFNPKYAGAGKVGLPRYIAEGLRSFLGGQHGNIAGGTTGMRALYERLAPWLGRAARGVGWAGSAPATGILTALTPSAGAGQQELQWEEENQRRMAAEAAAAEAAAAEAAAAAEPTGGGWQPDYSGAVASQQSQAAEAGQTHEQFMSDLDAVMAKGGLVSVNHLTRRL